MVKVTCLLAKAGSGVGLSFGVRALTQMEIRCVKGMFRLKLISSEKNSVFKGLMGRLSFHPIPCGSRDRPPGRKVIDEGKFVGHCACERQEQRVLLDR